MVPGTRVPVYGVHVPYTVPATCTFSYSGAYLVAPVLFEVRDVHGYATRGHDDDDDANDDERQWYVSGTTRYLVPVANLAYKGVSGTRVPDNKVPGILVHN